MQGYTITKKQRTDFNHILFSTGLILIFSAIFSPLFILIPLQDLLFKPSGHWFFAPPLMAHTVFILSLLSISIAIFFKLWLDSIEKFNGKRKLAVLSFVVISIVFMLLAINQYRYVDGNGIHVNSLFSLTEKHYQWSDIEKVDQLVDGGKVTFAFVFKNGEEYSMLLNEDERKSWKNILFEIEEQGIESKYINMNE